MDDIPVLVDGRVTSLRQHRERERIERELAELESDLVLSDLALDRLREREDDLRHRRRMFELHAHLARLRSTERRQYRGDLVFKVKYDALIR